MTFIFACAVVLFSLLFLDLFTKMLAAALLGSGKVIPVIPNFLSLAYCENEGFAFGLGSKTYWLMVLVTVLTVVMIAAIAVLFFTTFKKNKPAQMCLAVIEAGAVGNLIDRLCLRYVRDFVDVSAFRPFAWLGSDFNFGTCNIADFCITFGAVALLIVILFIGRDAVIPVGKWRRSLREEEKAKLAAESAESVSPEKESAEPRYGEGGEKNAPEEASRKDEDKNGTA